MTPRRCPIRHPSTRTRCELDADHPDRHHATRDESPLDGVGLTIYRWGTHPEGATR